MKGESLELTRRWGREEECEWVERRKYKRERERVRSREKEGWGV
jgi:hypothetical protein